MRIPWTGLVALGLAFAAVLRADDPATQPDSIAKAAKDFAAVKTQAPESTGTGTALDLKTVAPGPTAPAAPAPLPTPDSGTDATGAKSSLAAEKNANWLVDAMQPKDGRSSSASRLDPSRLDSGTGRDGGQRRSDSLLHPENAANSREERVPARDSENNLSESEKRQAAGNPLDSFMAAWVSARDRDLILPSKTAAAPAEPGQAAPLPGLDTPAEAGEVAAAASAGALAAPPAANPYLAGLEFLPTASAAPNLAPLAPPEAGATDVFAPASLALGSERPSDALAKPLIPAFAQNPDDDKAFKQMKRF